MGNRLTAVVTYKTMYKDNDWNNLTLSFGLGAAVKVNTIIGLPTFKTQKLVLDIYEKRVSSK